MPKTDKTIKEAKVKAEPVVKPTIIPVMTEKAYASEASRVYVFQVPRGDVKTAIAQKIEKEFGVHVVSIRTLVRKGKPTRFSRGKHAYPGTTFRQDKKFAYVTVKEGERIPVFDEVNAAAEAAEAKTETKTDAKAEKKAAKAAEKAAKAEAKEEKTKSAKGDK